LRDIMKGEDPEIAAIVAVIAKVAPDILILTDFDYDRDGLALAAFARLFEAPYSHRFAKMPNTGRASGLDIDGNGRTGEARDALGYGRFAGDGGLAVLSRYPFNPDGFTDHTGRLWRDLPDAVLPVVDGQPFPSQAVWDVLPVSSTAHWDLPVILPDGVLHLLTFSATPPVFDGPEDMNGLRARDELRLWAHVLDGVFGPPPASFVVAGNSNLDPSAGDGDRAAMAEFLVRGDLQDPHAGQPNADWGEGGPEALRVSYLLPSQDWTITGAGTFWPTPDETDALRLGEGGGAAGPHRLIWLDISR
jgi:hypothetical protein